MSRLLIVLAALFVAALLVIAGLGPRDVETLPPVDSTTRLPEPTDPLYREKIVENPQLMLLVFTAKWCTYCKSQDAILKKIEPEYAGRIDVLTIDVDQHRELARYYEARGLPTLVLSKQGEILARGEGLVPEADLKTALDDVLKKEAPTSPADLPPAA